MSMAHAVWEPVLYRVVGGGGECDEVRRWKCFLLQYLTRGSNGV